MTSTATSFCASPPAHDFDPQAPFIGSDGVEYACLADKIIGKPRESFYSFQIRRYQEANFHGKSREERIAWFRRKYEAFRRSDSYVDAEAEGERHPPDYINFGPIANRFHVWTDGPSDPSPIEPRCGARTVFDGIDDPSCPF